MTNSRRSMMLSLVIGLVGFAGITAAQEDDWATVSKALAPRAEGLIIARCSVCHSPDLIAQQRLPRERWEATVEKMQHWGTEISNDEADLLKRYLSARYHPGAPDMAAAPSGGQGGACAQPRKTAMAPDDFLNKTNPLPASAGTIQEGKTLFLKMAQPVACAMCHGEKGDGKGLMGAALVPPPRNFACGTMMKDISDGQLFWIIKNGSPGTGMMSFAGLSDEQVWQLIHYIRSLAK